MISGKRPFFFCVNKTFAFEIAICSFSTSFLNALGDILCCVSFASRMTTISLDFSMIVPSFVSGDIFNVTIVFGYSELASKETRCLCIPLSGSFTNAPSFFPILSVFLINVGIFTSLFLA